MTSQVQTSVENNFTKGLVTERTGLNFPENAATDCDNCEFTLLGDVLRRLGVDFETNHSFNTVSRTGKAITSYKWNNVGGDGDTQLFVVQIGNLIHFYSISQATETSPISQNKLSTVIDMNNFVVTGNSFDNSLENQYTDGNGYLFIFNELCNPVYLTYDGGTITGTAINIKVRDFDGVAETIDVNYRPLTLSTEHHYNLQNQGWTSGSPWSATSTDSQTDGPLGSRVWNVQTGISGVTLGQIVTVKGVIAGDFRGLYCLLSGTVTAYNSVAGILTINVTGIYSSYPTNYDSWVITPTNTGYITTWQAAEGNYPSNADVWWYFKNSTGVFDPIVTQPNVTLSVGNAPQGHFLLDAFNQDRSSVSGLSLTNITTNKRPTVGCWFQGRVWYTGVNANQTITGTAGNYSWSENIYFSQVNIGTATKFGNCYQENDPTSETLNGILSTDGGVIQIQGSGRVFKLFPVQNGILVFASNGVWFITGNQGIGFTANDYTITKISSTESISSTSFVDVQGMPYFWNEEGIYTVTQNQGGLTVDPITVGTILSFYNDIPKSSKRYVRGAYHPIDYVIQWIYKSGDEVDVTDRYTFDRILNYNTYNKAFYPYTIDTTSASINSITYIQGPGSVNTFEPVFKYLSSNGSNITLADIRDTNYVDWASSGNSVNYTSYFVTGYKLHGQALRRFQIPYLYVYSRNDVLTAYTIQSLWDYATSGNSGRWSTAQYIENFKPNFGVIFRRHRLRGNGMALQIKVTSVDGMPFDIIGWSAFETVNQGV